MKQQRKFLLIILLSPFIAFVVINALLMVSFALAFFIGVLLFGLIAGSAFYFFVINKFKQKINKNTKKKNEKDENTIVANTGKTRKEINEIILSGNKKIKELFVISKKIEKQEISEKVRSICKIAEKIYKAIEKNPDDIRSAREFILYYIDTAVEIINKYEDLNRNKDYIENADITLVKAEQVINLIEEAFERQLTKIYNKDVINLEVEIKVLKQTIEAGGF